jgi:hypothetical protein
VEVLEFEVGLGISVVPESGGPPVGLVGTEPVGPPKVAQLPLDENFVPSNMKEKHLWIAPMERVLFLQKLGCSVEDISAASAEIRQVNFLREETASENESPEDDTEQCIQ